MITRSTIARLGLSCTLLAGCSRSSSESVAETPTPYRQREAADSTLPANVVDVTWAWVSLTAPDEEIRVDSPERYTLRFEDGRAALRADCNRGTTSYSTASGHRISFKPMALTRAMCPPGSLSDRFVRDVSRATSYSLKSGDLYLELPGPKARMRFRKQG